MSTESDMRDLFATLTPSERQRFKDGAANGCFTNPGWDPPPQPKPPDDAPTPPTGGDSQTAAMPIPERIRWEPPRSIQPLDA